jgi:hypothetical protein
MYSRYCCVRDGAARERREGVRCLGPSWEAVNTMICRGSGEKYRGVPRVDGSGA